MTRLFLATALVLHLSGVAAVAAFVCTQPAMTARTCCCHQDPSDRDSSPRTPEASAPCPCAMSPALPAPVSSTPVTVSTSHTPGAMPATVTPVPFDPAAGAGSRALGHRAFADTGPPLLSASPLRC
jgi:hypothetical protein